MAKIVIKKRIDLDFLGQEYVGGYVVFKSISVNEIATKTDEIKAVADDDIKARDVMIGILQENFISGIFKDETGEQEIKKEDIGQFDSGTIIKFYQILSGRADDPKD